MNNTMTIDGRKAVVAFDPDIGMFRGEKYRNFKRPF